MWVVGISKSRMVAMAELIVFAFSDIFSAENSKFSADSGIHGIHFLECMGRGQSFMRTFLAQFLFECSPIQFTGAAPEPKTCQLKFLFNNYGGLEKVYDKNMDCPSY